MLQVACYKLKDLLKVIDNFCSAIRNAPFDFRDQTQHVTCNLKLFPASRNPQLICSMSKVMKLPAESKKCVISVVSDSEG
jgi:hypothetical protein